MAEKKPNQASEIPPPPQGFQVIPPPPAGFTREGGEDREAIKAAQAKKYPSSQEQKRGGKGVDDTAAGRFVTNLAGGAYKTTAPLHSPIQTLKSLPSALVGMTDSKNSALQAAAARERGEANPDPYGLLPLTDAATRSDLPTVAGEVGGQLAGVGLTAAATGAAIKAAAPIVRRARKSLSGAVTTAGNKIHDAFRPPPDVTAVRALGDSDPAMLTQYTPKALDEIKAWEAKTGLTADTIVKQRAAIANRLQETNAEFNRIAQVQRDVKVPGSRAKSIQAQIEAIPEDIKLTKPQQYQNLVKSIERQLELPDYTIGELDEVRQSLGAKNASYGKDASHQIAAEHSTKAIDAALENFARKAQYEAMDWNVAGTGVDGAELKSRIGAMINYDDALFKKNNKAITQSAQPWPAKVASTAGKILSPGKTLRDLGEGKNLNIDSELASAARRWKGRPEPTTPLAAPTPPQAGPAPGAHRVPSPNGETWQLAPSQGELLPNDVNAPLFEPPPGTSSAIGQDIFRIQQRTPRYQSSIEGAPSAPRSLVGGVDEGMVAPQEGFKPSVTIRDWTGRPQVAGAENVWPSPTNPRTQQNMPGALPRPENPVQAESFYPGKSGLVPQLDETGAPIMRSTEAYDLETGAPKFGLKEPIPQEPLVHDYTRQPHLFGLQQGQDPPPFSMKDITDRGLMGSHGASRMARIADTPFDMDFLRELEETGGIDPADAAKIRRDLSGPR